MMLNLYNSQKCFVNLKKSKAYKKMFSYDYG